MQLLYPTEGAWDRSGAPRDADGIFMLKQKKNDTNYTPLRNLCFFQDFQNKENIAFNCWGKDLLKRNDICLQKRAIEKFCISVMFLLPCGALLAFACLQLPKKFHIQ